MNDAAVERLIGSSEALIAALDAHDIEAIESALPVFGESVQALKSVDAWQRSPRLSLRVAEALKLAETARVRICYLADRTRQRIDMLAVATARFDCTPATYDRPGR